MRLGRTINENAFFHFYWLALEITLIQSGIEVIEYDIWEGDGGTGSGWFDLVLLVAQVPWTNLVRACWLRGHPNYSWPRPCHWPLLYSSVSLGDLLLVTEVPSDGVKLTATLVFWMTWSSFGRRCNDFITRGSDLSDNSDLGTGVDNLASRKIGHLCGRNF